MDVGWMSGADIVARIAIENSINPRLLLALLEYQTGCVLSQPPEQNHGEMLMGAGHYYRKDLYGQLVWAVHALSEGYYGWKAGALTEITLADGTIITPGASAGEAALQRFFAELYGEAEWRQALDPENGFPARYLEMFGDPWERARAVEPLFPADLTQPEMILPFEEGKLWSFTGGPHPVWEGSGPLGGLDFAPASLEPGCAPSPAWVVASAPGLVTRSGNGVVALDLDQDGRKQTGWVLLYKHIGKDDRVALGSIVDTGDRLGHPSCEGGIATGTHVHLARKYNGEWLPADGPLPFNLGGWIAHNGAKAYEGSLTRGDAVVLSNLFGTAESRIIRDDKP
jgi:murein DD-endopeptidase MepM/ murein hydrolase activator NlpD